MVGLDTVQSGDGYIDQIYSCLWSKPAPKTGPWLRLPDTIVFRYSQIHSWFFTAADGCIKKRHRKRHTSREIMLAFSRGSAPGDVIALQLTPGPKDRLQIQYLDAAELDCLLSREDKPSEAILQRFVPPRGDKYSIVQAVWSPQMCLLEKFVCNQRFQDRQVPPSLRVLTVDGAPHQVTAVAVHGPAVVAQYEHLCHRVAQHISKVSTPPVSVTRLVLNFAEAANGSLVLLWCSSLRLLDQMNPVDLSPPVPVDLHNRLEPAQPNTEVPFMYRSMQRELSVMCPSCHKPVIKNSRFGLTMLELIEQHAKFTALDDNMFDATEELLSQADDGEREKLTAAIVPPEVLNLFPKVTVAAFRELLKDPKFMSIELQLCVECFERLKCGHEGRPTRSRKRTAKIDPNDDDRGGSLGYYEFVDNILANEKAPSTAAVSAKVAQRITNKVSPEETLRAAAVRSPALIDQTTAELFFKECDKNRSGKIELTELRTVFELLGIQADSDVLNSAFVVLDKNFDEEISFEEFWEWWQTAVATGAKRGGAGEQGRKTNKELVAQRAADEAIVNEGEPKAPVPAPEWGRHQRSAQGVVEYFNTV